MKNLFGESFLARKSRKMIRYHLWLALSVSLLLGACASPMPGPQPEPEQGPVTPGENEVHSRVRDPAKRDSEGVQVFPLQNPAVKELLADAGTAESNGDYGQAASLLERALRIQPRDPEILQTLAEVQMQIKDYGQALSFATRSYDLGPRVGEICSRNWHTISVCREHLGDHDGSVEAAAKARACMNSKPKSM
jgi:tetratricopeptide (TPR) repeat protein